MNISEMTNGTYSCNSLSDGGSKPILIIYTILVTVGLLGNAAVITMIIRVVLNKGLLTNVYVYVLFLSALDFAYLSTGPFLIAYMISGTWSFGETLCRLNYVFEGLNKTMSIYLLVVLSGDRYLAACHPTTSSKYRSVKSAIIGLIIVFAGALLTNIPIYMYTEVKQSHLPGCYQCGISFPRVFNNPPPSNNLFSSSVKTSASGDNITLSNNNTKTSNERNNFVFQLPSPWTFFISYYLLSLIIVYYMIPAGLISFFYFKIVTKLRHQFRLVRKMSRKRNSVTKSVMAVVVFYFVCWTPYWSLQCLITYFPYVQYASERTMTIILYLATSIYMLPYINSCLDPILYAFLNKHLWLAYAASRSKGKRMHSKCQDPGSTSNVFQRQISVSLMKPVKNNLEAQKIQILIKESSTGIAC